MKEDLGTAASAVGRYQVAWALGCRSYYSCRRPHNNDKIILTRNDAAGVHACRNYASLQRDVGNITRRDSMPSCDCFFHHLPTCHRQRPYAATGQIPQPLVFVAGVEELALARVNPIVGGQAEHLLE